MIADFGEFYSDERQLVLVLLLNAGFTRHWACWLASAGLPSRFDLKLLIWKNLDEQTLLMNVTLV